jgi:hypothetical protein
LVLIALIFSINSRQNTTLTLDSQLLGIKYGDECLGTIISLLLKNMINYYFFQFIKKKIRTGPWTVTSRPVGVRPPGANCGTGLVFSNLDRLGPNRVDRRPWTVRDCGLSRFGPDRLQYSNRNHDLCSLRNAQFGLYELY